MPCPSCIDLELPFFATVPRTTVHDDIHSVALEWTLLKLLWAADAACIDLEPGQRVVVGVATTFVYPALCTDEEPVGVVEECEVFQLLGAAEESFCGEEDTCFYQVRPAF